MRLRRLGEPKRRGLDFSAGDQRRPTLMKMTFPLRHAVLQIAVCALIAHGLGAQSATPALQSFTGGGFTTTGVVNDGDPNNGVTVGWGFIPLTNLSVTALGYFDSTPSDDLFMEHPVGIWDSLGTQIVGGTVGANDLLASGFRYTSVAFPVTLYAGQLYLIGAWAKIEFSTNAGTDAEPNFIYSHDPYLFNDSSSPLTGVFAPEIGSVFSARNEWGTGFAYPDIQAPGVGRYGPNFQYVATAIPEPGVCAMITGIVGFAAAACRRRSIMALSA